jgi:iron(III) transport system permease protein
MFQTLPRRAVVAALALSVFFPLGLVFYQSVLSGPFFMPAARLSLESFAFIFDDPDFWSATKNTLIIAVGMSVIAIPLGAILAFIMVRTDLPGRRWLETPILIPIFVSPVVLGFGYVVSLGPVGFFSVWFEQIFGSVPWNIYSMTSIVLIAGLTHVPHVYLYSSSALRNLGSDVEEAARLSGASPFRVARDVSIPMVSPALLYVGVLVFFLGFEIFGLPLILGDPEGHLVLTTYLYKLTNKLGTPSYHLMAAVATCIIAVTFPLVLLQRVLLKSAQRFVAVKGKSARQRRLALGGWKWLALALISVWLVLTIVVPVAGVALRSVVSSWGAGINLLEVLTLDHFRAVFEERWRWSATC